MEVSFPIKSEMNVREAFSQYADEFGYTIVDSRDDFPDYELEAADGTRLMAEAQKVSADFFAEHPDPSDCDLIVCWYDNRPVTPLPTLELGNYVDAPAAPSPPNEYVAVRDVKTFIKTVELGHDDDGTLFFKLGNFERRDRSIAHESSNTPYLRIDEFHSLLRQIPEDVREAVFLDLELDRLRDWHQSLSQSKKPRPNRKGHTIAVVDAAGGEEKALRFNPDYNYIRVDEYRQNGSFAAYSQQSANLTAQEFREAFLQIPREIRKGVFLQVDLELLWNWHVGISSV